jgi:hypothetical protein
MVGTDISVAIKKKYRVMSALYAQRGNGRKPNQISTNTC